MSESPPDTSTIGGRIAAARGSMLQRELAERIGVSGPRVSAWENNKHTPTAENLEAIARALNVSTTYLLTGNGKQTVTENVSRGTSGNAAGELESMARRVEIAITRANQRRNEGADEGEISILRARVEAYMHELIEAADDDGKRARAAVALTRLALMPSDPPTGSVQPAVTPVTKQRRQ